MISPAQGMPCPLDGTTLVMSERSGIEIDYCPTCRGVWLDRGELDKIIERSAFQDAPPSAPVPQANYRPPSGNDGTYGYGSVKHGHRKRKKSFLEELFD